MVKVRAKGIVGPLACWLHNWLLDRKQAVRVRDELSGEEAVESGVPQGTVLGPCLFRIHIDNLDELVKRLVDMLSKFAADTKGKKIIRTAQDAQQLQEALNLLGEWATKWGMSFNEHTGWGISPCSGALGGGGGRLAAITELKIITTFALDLGMV
jgi:Reverse transcriptase (RNA-dependent DNA polymerase)